MLKRRRVWAWVLVAVVVAVVAVLVLMNTDDVPGFLIDAAWISLLLVGMIMLAVEARRRDRHPGPDDSGVGSDDGNDAGDKR